LQCAKEALATGWTFTFLPVIEGTGKMDQVTITV
jgi:hypothetical protein